MTAYRVPELKCSYCGAFLQYLGEDVFYHWTQMMASGSACEFSDKKWLIPDAVVRYEGTEVKA